MFDTLGYGTLRTYFADTSVEGCEGRGKEIFRVYMAKVTGELEELHAEEISRAVRLSAQWMDAGLAERAFAELGKAEPFVSFCTDLGADFHLKLAAVHAACGRPQQATRLRSRVASEARSSSARWAAEQAMRSPAAGAGGGGGGSSANPEMGKLFGAPPGGWS